MNYFFDLYQAEKLIPDAEGVNLTSIDDAMAHAVSAVRKIVAEQAKSGEIQLDAFVDIRLDQQVIACVRFSEAFTITGIQQLSAMQRIVR